MRLSKETKSLESLDVSMQLRSWKLSTKKKSLAMSIFRSPSWSWLRVVFYFESLNQRQESCIATLHVVLQTLNKKSWQIMTFLNTFKCWVQLFRSQSRSQLHWEFQNRDSWNVPLHFETLNKKSWNVITFLKTVEITFWKSQVQLSGLNKILFLDLTLLRPTSFTFLVFPKMQKNYFCSKEIK